MLNVTGHLRKRGKYWYLVYYDGVGTNGKKKYKWVNTKCEKKPEAEKVKRKILTQIDNGTYVEPNNIMFGAYIKEWIEEIKDSIAETTYEDYKGRIDKYIEPYFRKRLIQKLKPKDIRDYYKWLRKEHNLSINTIHRHHANIHKCLDYAWREDGIVQYNVSDAVELPQKEKYQAKFYDGKLIKKLLETVKGTYVESAVTITIGLGLRRGEILGLKWEHINFDLQEVYIESTRVRNKKEHTKAPKTESSRRTLKLPEYLVKYLKHLQLEQKKNKEWKYKDSYNDSGYVCCKEDGSPISINYINEAFTKVLAKNNLPHIRFHDLRHSNATYLLKNGVTIKELQEWLGHSSIVTTGDIYAHVDSEQKKEIARKSNTMFKVAK